jgi:hypothetical protein
LLHCVVECTQSCIQRANGSCAAHKRWPHATPPAAGHMRLQQGSLFCCCCCSKQAPTWAGTVEQEVLIETCKQQSMSTTTVLQDQTPSANRMIMQTFCLLHC